MQPQKRIIRGPHREKPDKLLLKITDMKPGEPMPSVGDRVVLKNRSTGEVVGGRFIRHEYLDKCIVLPDIRINPEDDWFVYTE